MPEDYKTFCEWATGSKRIPVEVINRLDTRHMSNLVRIGNSLVGHERPVFIVAEIGINHNGDLDLAKRLIDAAFVANCDAVKFQKRTPEICVPGNQKDTLRDTPWGRMTYMEYRNRIEFGTEEYAEIDHYCREKNIHWFTSCWDKPSVDFMEQYDPVCYKIASATLTDDNLMKRLSATGRPTILSTGMSTMEQIRHAVSLLNRDNLIILHSTSSYPCSPDELNLRVINVLRNQFDVPIGYSGHEVGLQTSYAAVAIGACMVERHITLDRATWGSDQAASVEPWGFMRLVRDIRTIEKALGDGIKRVYESELPARARLRRN